MKPGLLLICLFAFLLNGCGQSGPLFLPKPVKTTPETTPVHHDAN